jgi:DNA-binding response OmpR family regulator
MMDTGIRVIVVIDQTDLRESLINALSQSGLDVTAAGSGLQFYRAFTGCSYSIAVLDAGLADQSAYVLAEYVRKNSCMGVIMLSGRTTVEDRIHGYGAGVDIYLPSPVDTRELTAAIMRLSSRLGRNGCVAAKPSAPESWQLLRRTWQLVTPVGSVIALTAKEMQFLACIAEAPGKPVRRDTLFGAIGYRDDEYASRAMDSLVRRLRRKVEATFNHPSPIKTIHTQGYCFSAPIVIA